MRPELLAIQKIDGVDGGARDYNDVLVANGGGPWCRAQRHLIAFGFEPEARVARADVDGKEFFFGNEEKRIARRSDWSRTDISDRDRSPQSCPVCGVDAGDDGIGISLGNDDDAAVSTNGIYLA